ncbi:hypothetical protein EDE05_102433 [Neorhizobium sp. R1-B]|uniref:hypothetical protein n=1 Tax=Neorhizobium sp. R1-B TaxID=2485162 RepID=UPI0010662113|nr:hypothetical protein [Neorhizobium sp. R1-B]TDX88456.1 hypothetical protein EDE05_102433 [Neorhizobium sp. R1-B]
MSNLYSWKELIIAEMNHHGDDWSKLVSITLSDEEAYQKFDSGYGVTNGKPFTAWTDARVYFPLCHDGAEWCGSAPRNPNGEALDHLGADIP